MILQSQWLEGNLSAAVAIRKDIGLNESLPVEQYSAILEEQMNKNFTASKLHFAANCSYAKYILTSWNAKLNGDAFMYAVSVISTVGKIAQNVFFCFDSFESEILHSLKTPVIDNYGKEYLQ